MKIYDFSDYKAYLKAYLASLPRKGRGVSQKMATYLRVSPVIVSQVIKGSRQFSEEQAFELAQFLGLNEKETSYLLLLVRRSRAGTKKLSDHYLKAIQKFQEEQKTVKAQVPEGFSELSLETKAIYYSNYYYSALRLMASLGKYSHAEDMADHLKMPLQKVREALDFLMKYGLVVEEKGELNMGPNWVYIEKTSPLVTRHHQNWRQKAIEKMPAMTKEELFYTSPYSLDIKSVRKVKKELLGLIDEVNKTVGESTAEELYCLNIDWFEY